MSKVTSNALIQNNALGKKIAALRESDKEFIDAYRSNLQSAGLTDEEADKVSAILAGTRARYSALNE